MKKIATITFVEACNYNDFPTGGQLTFAKQFINTTSNSLLLVGITCDNNTQIGKWTKIVLKEKEIDYLPVLYRINTQKKPLVPARIQWIVALIRYYQKIKEKESEYFFTQDISSLYPISKTKKRKIIHCSAGLNNPFHNTRYKWAKIFRPFFNHFWYKQLSKVDFLLAAADNATIQSLKNDSKELSNKNIYSFPTRFDDLIFYPNDKNNCRKRLSLNLESKIIITSGRLSNVKGWDLILEIAEVFKNQNEEIEILWIGDGEDRSIVENKIHKKQLYNFHIIGNVSHNLLADYINACDTYVLASYREGWSTSIVEALACGKNVVSTKVSSANQMIENSKNGFVIENRNAKEFSQKIKESFFLPDLNPVSLEKVSSYRLSRLDKEFMQLWEKHENQ